MNDDTINPQGSLIKSVTIEYMEVYDDEDVGTIRDLLGAYKILPFLRHIRVVTTTNDYKSGGQRGEPTISVTYEYL